mgnify:CR=1 FL=1
MRYWAAGLLLTVLLFGGGWLSSGAAPDVSRASPRDGQAKMRDNPPPMRTLCCGYGTGSRWWR